MSSEKVTGVFFVTLLVGRYTEDLLVYRVFPVSEVHFSKNHLWMPVFTGFFPTEALVRLHDVTASIRSRWPGVHAKNTCVERLVQWDGATDFASAFALVSAHTHTLLKST